MIPLVADAIIFIVGCLGIGAIIGMALYFRWHGRVTPMLPPQFANCAYGHDYDDPTAPVSTCQLCGIVRDRRGEHVIYYRPKKGDAK